MRGPTPALGLAGRAFFAGLAITAATVVAGATVAMLAGRRAADDAERRGLEQAADLTAQLLAGRSRSLAGGARVFVQGPYFRALVAERRRDDILDQAFEAADQLDADWVFITDEGGTLLAKSDEPAASGSPMAAVPLVAGALEGRVAHGYGVSRDTLLFQAVAVPIVVPGASPVGVLVATRVLDPATVADVRAATGAEVVFYTLDQAGRPRLAGTTWTDRSEARRLLPEPGVSAAAPRRAAVGGDRWALQGAAVTTAGGEVVGGYVVARPASLVPRGVAGAREALLAAAAAGLLLSLLATWRARRMLVTPARGLTEAAVLGLEGDHDTALRRAHDAAAGSAGEVREAGRALAALIGELGERAALASEERSATVAPQRLAREGTGISPSPSPARARSRTLALRPAARAEPRVAAIGVGVVLADRYALEAELGAGGTGVVYRAADLTLGETVALKVMRPELLGDPRAAEELQRELRLARRVAHRNVVRMYDLGASRGVPFVTMEYVAGESLATLLARGGALRPAAVLALARQLVRALAAAHAQGVVHGDLKPANLLVAVDGTLKVADFGVATAARRPHAGAPVEPSAPPHLAGAVVGTPEYVAPEVLLGATPDARADLYAAGMVLHECLSGATPYQRDTPRGFLARKLDDRPKVATSLTAGRRSLEGVVAWMLANDAAQRPATADEVMAALAGLEGLA